MSVIGSLFRRLFNLPPREKDVSRTTTEDIKKITDHIEQMTPYQPLKTEVTYTKPVWSATKETLLFTPLPEKQGVDLVGMRKSRLKKAGITDEKFDACWALCQRAENYIAAGDYSSARAVCDGIGEIIETVPSKELHDFYNKLRNNIK